MDVYNKTAYDEEGILDLSNRNLKDVPPIDNSYLSILYLQKNHIQTLPDNIFLLLPCLKWLDLRDNDLTGIPRSIQDHQHLTHLLLKNNKLTNLPNELGTVPTLKVIQLSGNPIVYPPQEIICEGTEKIKTFLFNKFHEKDDKIESCSSLNSSDSNLTLLSINLSEKDDSVTQAHVLEKCRKLAKCRSIYSHSQSSRYLRPLKAPSSQDQTERIRRNMLKGMALQRYKDINEAKEKILQDRRNEEHLRNWRQTYRRGQQMNKNTSYDRNFPFDVNEDCMRFLTREEIEKELPDKYRKRLIRKAKTPRQKEDANLAIKIKQLFEKLSAIDLNKGNVTPRTEKTVILNEITKMKEINEKIKELSAANTWSVDHHD